jgi:hypothetical protein
MIDKAVHHDPNKYDFEPKFFRETLRHVASKTKQRLVLGSVAEFACLFGNVISPGSTPDVESVESPDLHKIENIAASENLPFGDTDHLVLSFSGEGAFTDKVGETASDAIDNLYRAVELLLKQVNTELIMANVEYGKAMRRGVKLFLLLNDIRRSLGIWLTLRVLLRSIKENGEEAALEPLREETKLATEEKQVTENSQDALIPSYRIGNTVHQLINGEWVTKEVEPRLEIPAPRFHSGDRVGMWAGEDEAPKDWVEKNEGGDESEGKDDDEDTVVCAPPVLKKRRSSILCLSRTKMRVRKETVTPQRKVPSVQNKYSYRKLG